jgi:hypothetical protein
MAREARYAKRKQRPLGTNQTAIDVSDERAVGAMADTKTRAYLATFVVSKLAMTYGRDDSTFYSGWTLHA